jgi:PAS domain S-box-containing protein
VGETTEERIARLERALAAAEHARAAAEHARAAAEEELRLHQARDRERERAHGVTERDRAIEELRASETSITDRRAVEEELRASEARYRRIVEETNEGVWLIDAERRTQFVNARLAEIFGYPAADLLGKKATELAAAPPTAEAVEYFARLEQGQAGQLEYAFRKQDGATCWVSLATTPLLDAHGKYEGALAMVTDISERREASELRERIAAVVESSSDAISSCTLDGKILSWNQGAERLYGYTASEVIGKLPPSIRGEGELASLLARVAEGERLQEVDAVRRRKDGTTVVVSLTVSPMRAADGAVIGAAIISRDVSERRRAEKAESSLRMAEEQLRQAQKLEALGQLAGGVAHDFNNLLSVMLGYTSILMDDLPKTDPAHADVHEIHEAGVRATELTRQLLAFSRRQLLSPRVIDVDVVIARVERMLRRTLGEDIQLLLTRTGERLTVNADPGQLEQVLLNLALNARDAMPGGGRLTVETSHVDLTEEEASRMGLAPGTFVSITVTDNGVGMDEATRERIFEPFFTTKELGKGTGLGLSTVFGIVKQSDGHVLVRSTPREGTSFQLLLPATDAPAEGVSAPPPASEQPARTDETVLLVEDEDQVRALARNILRRAGYKVLEAANGGEALLIAEQHDGPLDVMITDVVMPRMGGHRLALRLQELRPTMKVLYMSGYTDDTMLQHGIKLGELAFLAKPFTPMSLTRKLREVLEAKPAP